MSDSSIQRALFRAGQSVFWRDGVRANLICNAVIRTVTMSPEKVTYTMMGGDEIEESRLGTTWDWAATGWVDMR